MHSPPVRLLIILLFIGSVAVTRAAEVPELIAQAALVAEVSTGRIVYEKNADQPLSPASLTKMMTEYLVLAAIREGKTGWDDSVRISSRAATIARDYTMSNVPLAENNRYTVQELFEAMAIYSANGAAMALAEAVAGTESTFVELMNQTAREMGLRTFLFVNCTGLNNRDLKGLHPPGTPIDGENILSARSCALLAYRLVNDFPAELEVAAVPAKIFRENLPGEYAMRNWNQLLPDAPFYYQGADGIKTGSTYRAGFAVAATAERAGLRLIAVAMKAPSNAARFQDATRLLDLGFAAYVRKTMVPAEFTETGQAALLVTGGKQARVDVAGDSMVTRVVRRGRDSLCTVQLVLKHPLAAPLQKNQVVGHIEIVCTPGPAEEYLAAPERFSLKIPVRVLQDVERESWVKGLVQGVRGWWEKLYAAITQPWRELLRSIT